MPIRVHLEDGTVEDFAGGFLPEGYQLPEGSRLEIIRPEQVDVPLFRAEDVFPGVMSAVPPWRREGVRVTTPAIPAPPFNDEELEESEMPDEYVNERDPASADTVGLRMDDEAGAGAERSESRLSYQQVYEQELARQRQLQGQEQRPRPRRRANGGTPAAAPGREPDEVGAFLTRYEAVEVSMGVWAIRGASGIFQNVSQVRFRGPEAEGLAIDAAIYFNQQVEASILRERNNQRRRRWVEEAL